MKKLPTIFTILAIISVFGMQLLYGDRQPETIATVSPSPEVRIEHTTPSPNVTYSFMAEVPGQTALDILEQKATVEYSQGSDGVVITRINELGVDENHSWALYINDVPSSRSADMVTVQPNDEVSFVYQEQ